jgi:hypothetical protein
MLTATALVPTASAATCSKPAPTTAQGYQDVIRGPINGKQYAADAGESVLLPDGKRLWVFGDTLIADAGQPRGNKFINNSAILVNKGCATSLTGTPDPVTGNPTSWVKPSALTDTPGVTDYYWSSTPYMDGSYLRMFLEHEYNADGTFHPIGSDIATFSLVNGTPQLVSVSKTPSSTAGENGPTWGASVYRDSTYTYIMGSWNKHETWVFGQYYYLARVPNGQVTTQSKWRFWDGSSWATDQAASQPIISGNAGLGSNATLYKEGGKYIIVGKKYDVFGTDLTYWSSPSLTGPWTEAATPLVAPIPNVNSDAGEITYLGLGHPHATLASGKLLVSWSLNSTDPAFFGDMRYGVYFAEVPRP